MTRRTLLSLPAAALAAAAPPASRTPVLVELFTSEGCSSCPPADRLLEILDQQQPVDNAEIIVLSEHVDYWNYIGWNDPFSSSFYTQRQRDYAGRLRGNGVYTPQMIVDGIAEFVGSDANRARTAIRDAARGMKLDLDVTLAGRRANVSLAAPPDDAEVFVVTARNLASSRVTRGENGGRELRHVSVATSMVKVGTAKAGAAWSGGADLKAETMDGLRVIAFAQQKRSGRIIAARRVQAS